MRGWDRRSWGSPTNEKWLWAFPIIFPLACVVLPPVAVVYSVLEFGCWLVGYRPRWRP